ncbi:MAG: TRAP transporter large permease [Syntrophaceae bacterium]|nr:TRAP transporter large permease [Syntrophaceae bacterium]
MLALSLLVLFFLLLSLNVPIAFALGGASILSLWLFGSVPLAIIPQQILAGTDSFPMLAVPLFILSGALMDIGGISDRLVRLAKVLVGHFRGGLGMVVVVAEIFFSDISGSTSADTAAIGGIMIPQLVKDGYSARRATAITAAACGMGMLVPPCITMVIYGVVGGVSIGELFAAGFIPAFLMALALMIQIYFQAVRVGRKPGRRAPFPEIVDAAKDSILALMMAVIIFGGILGGVFTPTEAAAVAVLYAILIGRFVYRQVSAKTFFEKVVETGKISGMVLLLVGTAHSFSWILSREQVPQMIAQWMLSLGGGKYLYILLTILVFLPLGAILEGVPAVILLTPIMLPIARTLGIDPVHYGIVIVACQGISVFTPPVGVSLFVACSIGKVTVTEVAKPLLPYLGVMALVLLVIAYLPEVSLLLPKLIFR